MKRREALKQASLWLGVALAVPVVAGAHGITLNKFAGIEPDAYQKQLIAELADVIIPETDTPGAKAVKAEDFVIRVMRDCYPMAEQQAFYTSLANFDGACKNSFGKTLAELSAAQKHDAVKKLTETDKSFFLSFKSLAVTGYFISEVGATKALAYEAVPGRFKACMPMPKGQKTWATN